MERFLELLRAEVECGNVTEVAYRIGVRESTLLRWLSGVRSPEGAAIIRAMRAYPTLIASVLPDDTSLGDFMSPSPPQRRSTDEQVAV
jgi:ABC-type hemin transport system ATPase subunit